MTSWVVVDSGLLLSTILDEDYSDEAIRLFQAWKDTEVMIAAPALLQYEIVAVLRKLVFRGSLSVDEALRARETLFRCPVQTLMSDTLLRRGYDLASQFNRPTAYDAQYLAVAEHLGCDFWTADRRLVNAVQSSLDWVYWVGDLDGLPTS